MKRSGDSKATRLGWAILSCVVLIACRASTNALGAGSGENARQQSCANLKQIGLALMTEKDGAIAKLACDDAVSNAVVESSAEYVFRSLLEERKMPVGLLVTSAYRASVMPDASGDGAVLAQHGASYSTWRMPRDKWEQAQEFRWRSPKDGTGYDFPVLWDKKPELYGGMVSFLMANGSVRCLSADEFGQYKKAAIEWLTPGCIEPSDLLLGLNSREPGEKARAIRLLGVRKDQSYLATVAGTLGDESGDVRGTAVWALGWIGSSEAVSYLVPLVKDRSVVVRSALADALGRIGGTSVVPPLAELVKDRDRGVRRRALAALGTCRSRDGIKILLPVLNDEDRGSRQQALESLIRLGWAPESE